MADLLIVNAGQHCWGVERERLLAALSAGASDLIAGTRH